MPFRNPPAPMNFNRTLRGGLAAFFAVCLSAAAATLKVKSGAVHEGNVLGRVVLKGKEKETPSDADPSKTVYTATYTVINGADLTAIDEKGIRGGRPVAVMAVTQEDAPLDDLDIVRSGLRIKPGPFAAGSTKAAGSIALVGGQAEQATASRDAVLGEYREENDKAELRPAIEIETASGVVKVPVADLVPLAPE